MLGREQIVYIDLGAEGNVKIGYYLTIYRQLGKGIFLKNKETNRSVQEMKIFKASRIAQEIFQPSTEQIGRAFRRKHRYQ